MTSNWAEALLKIAHPQKIKLGHCQNQTRPLRVETGEYRLAMKAHMGGFSFSLFGDRRILIRQRHAILIRAPRWT
jgi:hypothetical protein